MSEDGMLVSGLIVCATIVIIAITFGGLSCQRKEAEITKICLSKANTTIEARQCMEAIKR